ncbi:MAG: hypothetical protein R2746_02775 [Acidimicrobiales bacterium]|nr:hypothetical protein [Actinomycetota bacterium]
MRRTTLCLLLLTALLTCTLIAGTPVNNDPSPAARTAGIHLTTTSAPARAAQTALASMLPSLLALVAIVLIARRNPIRGRRADRVTPLPRALLRSRAGERRGPPLFA